MAPKKHTLDDQLQKYIERIRLKNKKSGESCKSSKSNWLGYTAAAGATFATPAIGNAAIVHSGPQFVQVQHPAIFYTQKYMSTGIDIDNDLVDDFTLRVKRSASYTAWLPTRFSSDAWRSQSVEASARIEKNAIANGGILGSHNATKLASGATISSGQGSVAGNALLRSQWSSFFWRRNYDHTNFTATIRRGSGSGSDGDFLNSQSGFVGVSFEKNGNTHYGWIKIHVAEDQYGPFGITATRWAYEDIPNKPIAAGVPEPTSGGLAALAAGAAGIAQLRRKRKVSPDRNPTT